MTGRRGNSVAPGGYDNSDLNPFPLGFALSVSVSAISVFLIIPMIAYVVPPKDRTDFTWWNQAIIQRVHVSSMQDAANAIEGTSGSSVDALWMSGIDDATLPADQQSSEIIQDISGKLHGMGVKLLVDFPAGHTPISHPWFQASRQGTAAYKHHYVWQDAGTDSNGTRIPPTNWLCESGGSAWSWDEQRAQYYLHQKHSQKPDLNYRNQDVLEDMAMILVQWAALGVDGLVMRNVHNLVEAAYLKDEPFTYLEGTFPGDYEFLRHIYTHHQPENHDVISGWREALDAAGYNSTVLVADMEAYIDTGDSNGNQTKWAGYYDSGAQLVVNPLMVDAGQDSCSPQCVSQRMDEGMDMVPANEWPNWLLPNVCSSDRMSRRERVIMSLGLLLPGSVVFEHKSTCRKEVDSLLEQLTAVREIPAFKWGNYEPVLSDKQVVSYLRYALGRLYDRYLVVANIGSKPAERSYSMQVDKVKIPVNGTVLFSTDPQVAISQLVQLTSLTLGPGQAMVIKFPSGAI